MFKYRKKNNRKGGTRGHYNYNKINKDIEAANIDVAQKNRLSDTMFGLLVGRIEAKLKKQTYLKALKAFQFK